MQSVSRLLITLALVVVSGFIIYKAINITPDSDQGIQLKANTSALFAANYLDMQNQPQALSEWQGKVMLVNFWATWCPPCREEMPELSTIQDKFRDQGVIVLGISTDDLAKTKSYIEGSPVNYPVLAGDMDGMDLSQKLGNNQGILPYSVLISRDGSIIKVFRGRIEPEVVEQAIQAILKP